MAKHVFLIFFFLLLNLFGHAEENDQIKTHYALTDDPIDVVIVSHPKDAETLDFCIEGIRENCMKIRRIIVVSPVKLTKKAEWFDEKRFPFSKDDVAHIIGRGNKQKIRSPGWYYQQLLKLYAPFVIPGISSNVLVIDADTIFMNPVEFLNDSFGGLFCFGHQGRNEEYFKHAERLVPGYARIYPEVYSVCHHMLFQKRILKDLFRTVEKSYDKEFWIAFCLCVDSPRGRRASEYEIYYNYALNHTDQVALRELKWTSSGCPAEMERFKREGYHFVSFHTYMRGKTCPG